MNNWIYENKEIETIEEFGAGAIGFVYLITNLTNNRKYIGKKILHFSKTKQVNKKKKRIKVESDWKEYCGSNKVLVGEIKNDGHEVKREILYICKSKGMMSYMESKLQFQYDVLLNEEFYNDNIMARIHRKHIKI